MKEPRSRRWLWPLLGLVLLAVVGAVYVHLLPVMTEEEATDARAAIRDRVQALPALPPRPAFGEGPQADQAAFDELFSEERWRVCFAGASEAMVPLPEPSARAWALELEEGEAPRVLLPSESARGVTQLVLGDPPREDPELRGAEAACAGLDERLRSVAATPDLRSPFRIPGGLVSSVDTVGAARAIALVARARWRDGDVRAALRILLDGMVVMRDLRRGNIGGLTTVVSVAGEELLLAHALTLLVPDTELEPAEFERLREEVRAIRALQPEPERMLAAEREGALGGVPLARLQEDVSLLVLAHAHGSVCVGLDVEDCAAALEAIPRADAPSRLRVQVLGERLTRQATIEHLAYDFLEIWPDYLRRSLGADAANHLLEVALALAAERDGGGEEVAGRGTWRGQGQGQGQGQGAPRCPAELDPALAAAPHADDPVTITERAPGVYTLAAPELRVGSLERVEATFVCPAARAAWLDADGRAHSSPTP